YLVIEHDVPVYRIHTIGMGNVTPKPAADGSKPRRISGGRVEIALLKNNLGDLETAQNAAGTPLQQTADQALPQSAEPAEKKAEPEKPKSDQEKPKTDQPNPDQPK